MLQVAPDSMEINFYSLNMIEDFHSVQTLRAMEKHVVEQFSTASDQINVNDGE